MQTKISSQLLTTDAGKEADRILRSCVHCGFCTATCPTYQLMGDELDGPRGRIYQIKEMLEGAEVSEKTLGHLDRCLSCRGCETTCPSGVEYGHLVDIGREVAETRIKRPMRTRMMRKLLASVLPDRLRFSRLLKTAALFRPLLPARFREVLPGISGSSLDWPEHNHVRRVLLIEGCVQPVLAANIDRAAAHVLDQLSISTLRSGVAQCCGAVEHHLNETEAALNRIRSNIDHWWPLLEQGVEAIVSTASACSLELKEYGYLLRHDSLYAEKAKRISALARDISEVVAGEDLSAIEAGEIRNVAFHPSCTLQHGQKLNGVVEAILRQVGYDLKVVKDAHICCGAAGTYAVMQPEIGLELRHNKLTALQTDQPQLIATANIGCLKHLDSASEVPVVHWIELLAGSHVKARQTNPQ
ncbi:glycolate oxidase iron-sulfur subunit [Mariprofundus micogutta]|uniref:Glycolate oxidase iron-sulfur subunit n=1 Tax=Mariprofundus micogutta TaxID=1921010 RepID=A0A1L8CN60_9PROT|nr:glycolate oxidase subunit GlcF [Mariprofundus micogutta]GAV20347.1 glycolate oxidase iron-sulfur subunit [Mariprofundus micogutta]